MQSDIRHFPNCFCPQSQNSQFYVDQFKKQDVPTLIEYYLNFYVQKYNTYAQIKQYPQLNKFPAEVIFQKLTKQKEFEKAFKNKKRNSRKSQETIQSLSKRTLKHYSYNFQFQEFNLQKNEQKKTFYFYVIPNYNTKIPIKKGYQPFYFYFTNAPKDNQPFSQKSKSKLNQQFNNKEQLKRPINQIKQLYKKYSITLDHLYNFEYFTCLNFMIYLNKFLKIYFRDYFQNLFNEKKCPQNFLNSPMAFLAIKSDSKNCLNKENTFKMYSSIIIPHSQITHLKQYIPSQLNQKQNDLKENLSFIHSQVQQKDKSNQKQLINETKVDFKLLKEPNNNFMLDSNKLKQSDSNQSISKEKKDQKNPQTRNNISIKQNNKNLKIQTIKENINIYPQSYLQTKNNLATKKLKQALEKQREQKKQELKLQNIPQINVLQNIKGNQIHLKDKNPQQGPLLQAKQIEGAISIKEKNQATSNEINNQTNTITNIKHTLFQKFPKNYQIKKSNQLNQSEQLVYINQNISTSKNHVSNGKNYQKKIKNDESKQYSFKQNNLGNQVQNKQHSYNLNKFSKIKDQTSFNRSKEQQFTNLNKNESITDQSFLVNSQIEQTLSTENQSELQSIDPSVEENISYLKEKIIDSNTNEKIKMDLDQMSKEQIMGKFKTYSSSSEGKGFNDQEKQFQESYYFLNKFQIFLINSFNHLSTEKFNQIKNNQITLEMTEKGKVRFEIEGDINNQFQNFLLQEYLKLYQAQLIPLEIKENIIKEQNWTVKVKYTYYPSKRHKVEIYDQKFIKELGEMISKNLEEQVKQQLNQNFGKIDQKIQIVHKVI